MLRSAKRPSSLLCPMEKTIAKEQQLWSMLFDRQVYLLTPHFRVKSKSSLNWRNDRVPVPASSSPHLVRLVCQKGWDFTFESIRSEASNVSLTTYVTSHSRRLKRPSA